ncbi:hypothetical protein [Pectobacterium aquaticum]|uniref:hypothetical protein n=1 Tax=Pectobacterium aquaticum TaxID=2204145 RepID=UPI000E220323|nr:hypothetical protein [Pectobacterium aquaticum]RRN96278.1 hypothetical protein DMB83_020050 [Pectobacterium aquaticum]
MNKKDLINSIDISELRKISSVIASYELLDNIKNPDDMASYLYEGGNDLLFASNENGNGTEEKLPKKMWILVRDEMNSFLCSDDEKYKGLWEKINNLEKFTTVYVVTSISLFLCSRLGFSESAASGVGQFVAIVLFFFLKFGKEVYCKINDK